MVRENDVVGSENVTGHLRGGDHNRQLGAQPEFENGTVLFSQPLSVSVKLWSEKREVSEYRKTPRSRRQGMCLTFGFGIKPKIP